MADEQEVAGIVAVLSAAYPNFKATEYTTEIYFQTLQDIPGDLLKAATLQCVAEAGRKFAPSVGEIRGTVLMLQKISLDVPSSYEAWQEVQQQILENGGDFGNPVFSHPVIEKTVRALGWRNLRMSENETADRARFIQAYEQFQDRNDTEEMMLPEVRGYIETQSQIKQLANGMGVKQLRHPHTGEVIE